MDNGGVILIAFFLSAILSFVINYYSYKKFEKNSIASLITFISGIPVMYIILNISASLLGGFVGIKGIFQAMGSVAVLVIFSLIGYFGVFILYSGMRIIRFLIKKYVKNNNK